MKKTILIFMLILSVVASTVTAFASFGIKLFINGSEVKTDIAPMIVNDRTMVPARVVFEQLNANVEWLDKSRQVVITTEDITLVFKIGSDVATVNNEEFKMDCAPMIVEDRTMIPIRFVSEKLGYTVLWDDVTKKVTINSPVKDESYEVLSVSTKQNTNNTQVLIAISDGVEPKVMTLKEPFRIVLDFEKALLCSADGKEAVNDGYINQVRWALHDEYTRVVIECPNEQPYTISGSGTKALVVKVGNKSSRYEPEQEEQQPEEPPAAPEASPKPEQPETKPESTPGQKVELTNIVVIDAGHGGKDVGALGKDDEGNVLLDQNGNPLVMEKDLNLYIAQKIRDYLVSDGVKVVMTRDDDTFEGTSTENLLARANLANNKNASLFLSVHNNSSVSPKANGTEVCYTPNSSGAYGITSMKFAKMVLDPLVEATGLTNRGLSSRPNLAVLKYTKMPAVLIECGFITNSGDRDVLTDKANLNKIARAVADGIINTLEYMNR